MKQSKKIFTRMVLNNWGGMNHEVIYFHEFVNLFSGKSGSGKSTAMDAMQVVLYGSVASDFLNKAADDTKNKRSVLSYLRGEQKDGSANRENQDFYAQIVLELEDTGTQRHSCIGVTFEVGHADQDLRKYYFFSHAGKFPEDDYLGADGLPYSTAQIRQLVQARAASGEKAGRMNINRIYPTKEAYISTVNEVIFGSVMRAVSRQWKKVRLHSAWQTVRDSSSKIICSQRVKRTRFPPSVTSWRHTVKSRSVWRHWRIRSRCWMKSSSMTVH